MNTMPFVSIVTVNYNASTHTDALLQSLRSVTYPFVEVWVVDNGSVNPPHYLQNKYPEVNFIFLTQNLGFAGGNNQALLQANGDYIILLNNDTIASPSFIEPMVAEAQKEGVGAVGAKLLFYGTNTLQYAGGQALNPTTVTQHAVGYGQPDGPQYNQATNTHYAHGAAMMVSREAINKAGLLPEDYFLYYEEIDWCRRIAEQGYTIRFAPQARVYHKESVSTGRNTPFQIYYKTRGRFIFAHRNLHSTTKLIALLYLTMVALPAHALKYLAHAQLQHTMALLKAAAAYWFGYALKKTPLNLSLKYLRRKISLVS